MSDHEQHAKRGEAEPRDAAYWAKPVEKLKPSYVPPGAIDLVRGRRLAGPIQGFGQLWQKTYRVRLSGAEVTPADVIRTWKENFPRFWGLRKMATFYAPLTGLAPGEVSLINQSLPGGARLSTGVLVLYADDESFTLMTPEGHPFAGWITFSAFRDDGTTAVQAQLQIRPSDPVTELAFPLGVSQMEDRCWQETLRSLAAHFGVTAEVETTVVCLDRRRQWSRFTNIWHNAGIRSGLYLLGAPLRWFRRRSAGS